jgi:peptide deformylase
VTENATEHAEGEVVVDEELDAEEQVRRRLALAQIRQYPDPALRMAAREVTDFDDELVALATRMKQLMHDAHGVGLAANQVGIVRRLFVFQRDEDDVTAVVNPALERGTETELDEEGCLSMQGVRVPVERATTVTLTGKDEHGGDLRLELEGLPARVAQHELDHLDGTLIIDRTDVESRRQALGVLRPQPVLTTG